MKENRIKMHDPNDNINKDFHNENHDFLKEQVGSSMHSFEAEPPAGLWNQIEAGIQKRHKRIILLRYSTIAASLLLLAGLGVTYLNRDHQTEITKAPVSMKSTVSPTSAPSQLNPASSERKQSSKTLTLSEAAALKASSLQKINHRSIKSNLASDPSKASVKSTSQPYITQSAEPKTKPVTQPLTQPVTIKEELAETPLVNPAQPVVSPEDAAKELAVAPVVPPVEVKEELAEAPVDLAMKEPAKAKPANHPSLALTYGLTSGTDLSQNQEAFSRDGGNQYSYDDFSASLANRTLFFEDIEGVDHDAPLALGITIDLPITQKLFFETGLLYTRLGYRVRTDVFSSSYSEYRNEFYYLGLPLGARYSFLERKRFDLYALQWIVLEKGIAGRYYIDTYQNDEIRNTESNHESIRGVQLSSVTALGGAIKITGNISLFAQGGVQVFFLNGTQPYNIRSNHIAWPSFQAGLRIGLNGR